MDTIKELTDFFVGIINAGVAARVIYCFLKINANPEEEKTYSKRIWNALVFTILANSIWALKSTVLSYFT